MGGRKDFWNKSGRHVWPPLDGVRKWAEVRSWPVGPWTRAEVGKDSGANLMCQVFVLWHESIDGCTGQLYTSAGHCPLMQEPVWDWPQWHASLGPVVLLLPMLSPGSCWKVRLEDSPWTGLASMLLSPAAGSTILAERGPPSLPCSPASTPTSPSALLSRLSDPLLSPCSSGPPGSSAGGEYLFPPLD